MQKSVQIILLAVILLGAYQASATPSAFWDELNDARLSIDSSPRYRQARTQWEAPRHSHIKPRNRSSSCRVKTAQHLPNNCIKKNRATRKGILSQIKYLKSNSSRKTRVRYASYQVGQGELLNTARDLLDWFDSYNNRNLAENFELHELDARTGRVKYTGYFTPFISARRYPTDKYRYPIYRAPSGRYPTRREIFNGALRGKGLEIAWTNDPVSYYQAQVQGSGILAFPNGEVADLHFEGKTPKPFVSVASYMHHKGYIKSPSNQAMRKWLEAHPNRLKEVLSVNPRFVFFTLAKHNNTRKSASGQPLIAGHTVAVDTTHIPFGSVLLAEIPMRNSRGKITGLEWRLLFPQDRGGAIQGTTRLDLYTGEGIKAKKMTNTITGIGRAYLLKSKSGRGRFKTAYRD